MEIGEEKADARDQESSESVLRDYALHEPGNSLNIWHLILIFFGGIGVCVLFFALGFLIGKNQGKMEQMIAAKSQETPMSGSASPISGSSGASSIENQAVANTGTKPGTQNKLDFYNEVNRNFKTDRPANELPSNPAGEQSTNITQPPPTPAETVAKPVEPTLTTTPTTLVPEPSTTPVESTPVAAVEKSEIYRVQVGAFRTQEESQSLVVELGKKGYEAFIEPPSGRPDNLFRVQMGPYSSKAAATEIIGRLKKSGMNALLKKY